MEIKQLNYLNQIYITAPDKNIPIDVCPRYEIAHPQRLYDALDVDRAWSEISIQDDKFQYKYIETSEVFRIDNEEAVDSHGFFVFTDGVEMFAAVSELLESANDTQAIYGWLIKWASGFFGVSCPILQQQGKAGCYSISHKNASSIRQLRPAENLLPQLVAENCYVLCNGMTMLLALNRLGLICEEPMFCALCTFLNEQSNPWVADMCDAYFQMYVSSSIPQIAEFPYIYACMGERKSGKKVIDLLLTHYSIDSAYPVITGVIPYRRVNYTSCTSAAFPYIRRCDFGTFDLHQNINAYRVGDMIDVANAYCTMDIYGMIESIVATRSMYKWWSLNAKEIMHDIISSFECSTIALSYVLKRLFFMYNKVDTNHTKSRIRKFWMEILKNKAGGVYTEHALYSWILKYIIVIDVHGHTTWLPHPPVAFLWDMINILDIDIYGTDSPAVSFMTVITKFERDQSLPLSHFRSSLESRITKRLAILKRICSATNKSTWDAMQAYYRRNPKLLYI